MKLKSKRPAKKENGRKPRCRYGIGEWYGNVFSALGQKERKKLAEMQFLAKRDRTPQRCPFRSSTTRSVPCTKDGGVCTLKLYEFDPSAGAAKPAAGETGFLISICPSRFQQNATIYSWIGETLLDDPKPAVVSEIGFLERGGESESDDHSDSAEDVGRIDNVLVRSASSPLSWCALEIQAVYFSGNSMRREFETISSSTDDRVPFPSGHRRPDYRSSGPKRLMPQLQIKVPTLRRWGKKMAVVVDRPFFNSLGKMDDVKEVSNCDIAWFVVRFEEADKRHAVLTRDFVRFTTLERAVEGLTGGVPVALAEFESRIRSKLEPR